MTAQLKDILSWTLTAVSLALLWVGVVAANDALFQQWQVSSYASFIYLPAALRIVFPLVFGNSGYLGIILGSFFVTQGYINNGIIDTACLAITSALAPFVGISVFKLLFTIRPDLADLKTVHLVALALLCAVSNALLLNIYFPFSGRSIQQLNGVMTILIGDILGTVIVLFCISFILTFFMSRRRA